MADKQDDLAKLSSLKEQSTELCQEGRSNEALPIAKEWLELSEKALGPEHPNTAISLNNLASLYSDMGDYAKAEPFYQRALKICEKALGPDHPNTGGSLNNLAVLYRAMGDYAKAEPLYQGALKIREKALGPEHPDVATTLHNLAVLYRAMGDYAKAEPLLQRALKIWEKALGPEHPNTAMTLNNLAAVYEAMGDYAKAEPLLQRALKIKEKGLGPEHQDTATSLNKLALLYKAMGDYAKAEPFYQRALKICEKALGPDHPNTGGSLNNLAVLHGAMGDYAKAEPLYQRALKISEKVLGPEHPNTATSLDNLAELYSDMGDYAKAKPLYQRALNIREKALGLEHPDTGISLNNLASLYSDIGDYAKAEPLLQCALKISEKALGLEHPDTAGRLNNLAAIYYQMGDYAKAEPLLQRALKISEKVLGPEHPYTATSLNNLAELYRKMGDYAKAEPLYQCALKISEKALGPEHPNTATSLNNLATTYYQMGDYAKVEPLYQRALKIREKALSPDHPDTAKSLSNLALLHYEMGDPEEALRLAAQARRGQEKILSNILSFTSEQQRLAFQKTIYPYNLPATFGNAPELAEIILRQKGVVLDSLLEDRLVVEASKDPRQREVVTELRGAKQRLMQLQLETPRDISEEALKKREAEKKELSQRVEGLEAGLARQVAGLGRARRALSVTVAQVQGALGEGETLIELLRYSHHLGKNKWERRYGAIIIFPNGEPKWVSLGSATEIERNIAVYQKSARGGTDEATLGGVLHALHTQIWTPIEKALPSGTKTIIISPDGALNFVSFATLVGPDDRFLAEKYSIRYVASGRDLLRQRKPPTSSMMFVFANPDFEAKVIASSSAPADATTIAMHSLEMRGLRSLYLGPLPGTEAEASALEKRGGKSVKVFRESNATEAELRQVNSPRVLHLATHGFFLPEIELGKLVDPLQPGREIPRGKLVNPMHRSGLALAGAQTTFDAWGVGRMVLSRTDRGEVPPTENDGIVTAEEVGGLKLDGTSLVVLSACDTGSGEARAGEGVMGLRRGFIQAGAQNLLMTLWPIDDRKTVEIMVDFYDAADRTQNPPKALAEVQRTWLVNLRKELGLSPAMRLAGAFILSSQGKP